MVSSATELLHHLTLSILLVIIGTVRINNVGNNQITIKHSLTYSLHGAESFLSSSTGLQLVENFPAFHGTRRFITALTSVRHLSLSWGSPIQSTCPQPTSWRYILILSTHLRLGLPSGLFPSGFPTKTLYTPSPHPYAPHAQPITIKHTFMK